MNLQTLRELPDQELLVRVKQLVQNERCATAALVAHLVEIECRQLYLGQGCRSLFTYCTEVLHLSEHAAYNRIEVARIAVRFPLVLSHLAVGDVHLTAVRLLGSLLTAGNHRELLKAAKHQSKRQIEELIARLQPQPDVEAVVLKLPARKAAATAGCAAGGTAGGTATGASTPLFGETGPQTGKQTQTQLESAATAPAATAPEARATGSTARPNLAPDASRRRASIVPLAPERYKVQFTATAATCGKLRRAQELLRHRIPDGDVAAVIDQALDLLVRELERKKFGATPRPHRPVVGRSPESKGVAADATANSGTDPAAEARARVVAKSPARALAEAPAIAPVKAPRNAPASPERSRYIPAAVKRAVWQRDGGRCTFVGASGGRCTERGQLEFDHIQPHADGGSIATGNLRLLCRQHNQYEARRFFGVWQADETEPLERQASQA